MYRWFRYSENPVVRFLPLMVFGPLVFIVIVVPIMFRGMGVEYFLVPVLVVVCVMHVVAYLFVKRAVERVPDNISRLYKASFEEASQRFEEAMDEAGIKYMRYSPEEYREMGLIEELTKIGYRSQEPTWIYQLDAGRAAVLRRAEYPKGHSNLMLFPYEEEGIHLMDKVKEVADAALGP
jgi:hypothetical protein